MFKVEMIVDDKKLAELLRRADGLCFDLKVMPVKMEDSSEPTKRATSPGGQASAFLRELLDTKRKHNVKEVTAKELREAGISAGFPKLLMNGAINRAVMRGMVGKSGTNGVYLVPKGEH